MRFAEIFKTELFSKYKQKAGCYINEIYDILKKINKKRSNVNVILVDVRASKNQTEVDFERILDIVKKYEYINFCYGGNIATWKQVAMLNNLGVGAVLGKNYLRGDFV